MERDSGYRVFIVPVLSVIGNKIWEKCRATGCKTTKGLQSKALTIKLPQKDKRCLERLKTAQRCSKGEYSEAFGQGLWPSHPHSSNLMLTSIYSVKMITFTRCQAFLLSRNPVAERKKEIARAFPWICHEGVSEKAEEAAVADNSWCLLTALASAVNHFKTALQDMPLKYFWAWPRPYKCRQFLPQL